MTRPRRGVRLAAAAAIAGCAIGLAAAVAPGAAPPAGPFRLGPLAPVGSSTSGGVAASGEPAPGASGRARPTVVSEMAHARSRPLRSIAPLPAGPGAEDPDAAEPVALPGRQGAAVPGPARDPVLQSTPGQATPPSVLLNFEGVNNVNGVLPPDTNGDIGPKWVNLSFAVYDRSGTKLYGPAAGNTLWTDLGGVCATQNDGDPIVQYDHLADRWLMSQFALPNYPSGPFYQCLAVSAPGDPLGAWNLYQFQISATKLNDYPHFGVWPDGYYMSVNQYSGNSWGGQGVVAFDRAKMLAGQSATAVYFDLYGVDPNLGGMLPSDLDGPAPPAGAPNVFLEADDNGSGYA
jgi:hypothetical protein